MKIRGLFLLVLIPIFTYAQSFGPAEGFPSDPVISIAWHGERLYLGTQGSGVFELVEDGLIPSDHFANYSRNTVFGFNVVADSLVPLTEGKLQSYPLGLTNVNGTNFIVTEGLLDIQYSDYARVKFIEASGIWRFSSTELASFPDLKGGAVFLRTGSRLLIYSNEGMLLDETAFKGLIFDIASTQEGLLLSTEGGYYSWRGHWHKVGAGMPIFAFDGAMARTPIGSIPLTKILSGSWSSEDVLPSTYRGAEKNSDLYSSDVIGNIEYQISSRGLLAIQNNTELFSIGRSRGFMPPKPGNYDVTLVGDELWVATPSGVYTFANQGLPNPISYWDLSFEEDGLPVASLDALQIAPHSIGFTADIKLSSASPVLARYRFNEEDWQIWDPKSPVVFDHPAPGRYELDVQLSTRRDFYEANSLRLSYIIRAPWFKRPLVWSFIILLISGIIIFWQRQLRQKADAKLALTERLADAELASKRSQMNPHFLFNALDAISNFIFTNQPKDAVNYMGKLAKLMRLTLDGSRSTTMVLADEVELLKQYIALCELRYGSFGFDMVVDDEIDQFDTFLPPLLLQPIVENAIQHAVRPNMQLSLEANIKIQFSATSGGILVTVIDNGPGYKKGLSTDRSHGLAIIEERLDLLSKKHQSVFQMSIISSTMDASISGTHVSLILSTHALD